MKRFHFPYYFFMIPAAAGIVSCGGNSKDSDKPNVIFILADDLGYGDLSCMGQNRFQTPNIDRLASEGMLFTQHYAGAPVSAPSRASFLTGLHSGHAPVRDNKEMPGEGQYPMSGNHYTLFDLFGNEGYITGAFGKWGLGYPGSEGDPKSHGVDDFFGYNCQRYAHSYYPDHLWDNDVKVIQEGNSEGRENDYAPYVIHDQAIDFIKENSDKPFFMYYASVLPHAELLAPKELVEPFKGKFGKENPYHGYVTPEIFRKGAYQSQEYPRATFAAMVTLLDAQVGDLVRVLEEEGIADNTIVVFASDNGPHIEGGADPVYFDSNAELSGIKRDLYEGGIRVPFIVRWPQKVRAGSRSDHVGAFWDFLPTMAELLGVRLQSPTDGVSYLSELTGEGVQKEHDWLYWEFHGEGGRQAVRKGDWKAIIYNVSQDRRVRLYNLADDLGEKKDVASLYPDIVADMDSLIRLSHTPSEIFPFPGD